MRKPLLKKYENNPVLSAQDFPEDVMYVFNPGAIKYNDQYLLICDAALNSTSIILWIARSNDGINFLPDENPISWPKNNPKETCVYDPRITKFGDDYVIMYASHCLELRGPRIGMVKTKDFINFERIVQSDNTIANRNGVLFPEKIKGEYVRLDRPMHGGDCGTASMAISYSDNLMTWGKTKELMQPRPICWDSHKIGGAAVPIKTNEGWLTIYHGVDNSSCNNYIYRLGIMLLDLEDPSEIIARSESAILSPEFDYEFFGRTPNVVFSCNALVDGDDVRLYYGAADSCIALATGKVSELLKFSKRKNILKDNFFK